MLSTGGEGFVDRSGVVVARKKREFTVAGQSLDQIDVAHEIGGCVFQADDPRDARKLYHGVVGEIARRPPGQAPRGCRLSVPRQVAARL